MKTICFIMLAFALMCGQAFSQVETERKAGFQFGLYNKTSGGDGPKTYSEMIAMLEANPNLDINNL